MPDTPSILAREEVMFFDTDCGGVVHNLSYLRMIKTARTRLAAQTAQLCSGGFAVELFHSFAGRDPADQHGVLNGVSVALLAFWASGH